MSAGDLIALRRAYALVCPQLCTGSTQGPAGPAGPAGEAGPAGPTGFSTGAVYYFNNDVAGATPNTDSDRQLSRVIRIGAQTSVSHTFGNTAGETVRMQSFITPNNDPNVNALVGGTFEFEIYADTTAASATISDHTIFSKIYLYHIDNSRTLISESFKIPIYNKALVPTLYIFTSPVSAQNIVTTDRFEIELWAQSITNTNNKRLTLYFNNGSIGKVTTTLNPFTANFPDTNYRDTTTLSFFNGTNYYYTLTGAGTAELNTILNVPNIVITYIAIIYFCENTPINPQILIKTFDGLTTLATTNLSASATDGTIIENTCSISTSSPRALKLFVSMDAGSPGGAKVNIRTIVIGYA